MAASPRLSAVVRHPTEPRVLLLRSDRSWRLPRVGLGEPFWAANAQAVVPAFERRLGTRVWLLRVVRQPDDELSPVVELELLDRAWRAPGHGRWAGPDDLNRVTDERDRELLAAWFADVAPPERPPWARPGWAAEVHTWLEQEADRLGHTVVDLEQVKHWSISSVLRMRTDGPELYLKAPARLPLFVDEAAVTARLAARFPKFVPAPLAIEPERGWLVLPAFDSLFSWSEPLGTRCEVLSRFAALQRSTSGIVPELLADGCIDGRLDVLAEQLEPLVHSREAAARLSSEEVVSLRSLLPTFREVCRQLGELGIPDTLVHGDLHLGNVARLGGRLVYFDWTDACIAHPFIDLLSLRWEQDKAAREALLDAYLEPWAGVGTPERLREAVELATVVIPLHHAVSYAQIVAGLEPVAKPELDATHEFLREAIARAREL